MSQFYCILFYFLFWCSIVFAQRYSDDETAVKNISAGLKKDPKNPSLLFQFAWFMQKKSFDDLAEKYYKKCLAIRPKYSPALVNLGNLYARRGKMFIAEEYFLKAIGYNPNAYEAHYNIGAFYLKKKDYKKAILSFEKTISLNPNSKEALLNLARIHLFFYSKQPKIEQISIAKEYLITAAKIAPKYAHIYFNLGKIFEIEGKKGVALQYYERARALYRHDSKYYKLLIQKIAHLKSKNQAKNHD